MKMIDALCSISQLSENARRELELLIVENRYRKGHHLLNLWNKNYYFHFIVSGSGRVYYMKDGNDITDYLAMDGQFIGGLESLVTKEPSPKAIQLTEDSVVQSLIFDNFEKLCYQHHEVERLGRKMSTFAFLEAQKRIESIRFLSASERYEELEKKYPGITNRIPLKYLASYLGTTPVSLSRIRSGIQ